MAKEDKDKTPGPFSKDAKKANTPGRKLVGGKDKNRSTDNKYEH
jgi:hypothetical protein